MGEMRESFVSTEAARRLSCDAGVIEIVESEHGTPLSVGRKRRTIAGALNRALHKRDAACTYPGCTHRIFLEGHHIKHWADGGETSLSNTALLCSLPIAMSTNIDTPSSSGPINDLVSVILTAGWCPRCHPVLRWRISAGRKIRAANEPLAIDADTIACEWDGKSVDYGAIVGHLVTADGLR